MNMKYFGLFSVAVLSWVLGAPVAEASILSSKLTFDGPSGVAQPLGAPQQLGGEDKMQDDSLSSFVNVDGSTTPLGAPTFTVGDIIWGVLSLSDIDSSGQPNINLPPGQVAFVFSAKIAASGGGVFSLAPINDTTSPYDLSNLIDGSVQSGLSGDTILTALSSADDSVANNPLNWATSDFLGGVKKFSAANGWGWELTADMVSSDDFFEFQPGAPALLTGTDRGGLTITSNAFGAAWLPVDVFDFGATTHYNDLTLDLGTVSLASGDQVTKGWTFTDQSTFYVNPVPEPSAMLTWLGLAGVSAVFVARRRRSA